MKQEEQRPYLECEKLWVFLMLMASGGFMGAYTFILRGGVFCNAQTSNILLFGISLGTGEFEKAAYYLIPITAYGLGAFVSEILPVYVRRVHTLRWDTLLIGIEIVVLLILGALPDSAPFQITQVAVNFICSMQYNTFRQAQGIPMATTFCTNHLRQVGIGIAIWIRKKEKKALDRSSRHGMMLLAFAGGAMVGAICCGLFGRHAIWGSAVIQSIVFSDLLHADLTVEKGRLDQKPLGH